MQPGPPSSEQPYGAIPRYWQLHPPVPYPAPPPFQQPYPVQFPPSTGPPDNNTMPGLMEMVIASAFGIPKPKLTIFSSGRESDFIMLKKGLDSVFGPHKHLTEDYKYQILLDHLRFPSALKVAKRYVNNLTPYTSAMQALTQRYGQPRQLVQGELKAILTAPAVKAGDYQGFEDFAASVGTLVGMLTTMDGSASSELSLYRTSRQPCSRVYSAGMEHAGTNQLPPISSRCEHLPSFIIPLFHRRAGSTRRETLAAWHTTLQNRMEAIRSVEDKAAIEQLEQKTVRVTIDAVSRYATPLLHKRNAPILHVPPTAVMSLLRATERRLSNNPEQCAVYNEEIHKLEEAGYTVKISANETSRWSDSCGTMGRENAAQMCMSGVYCPSELPASHAVLHKLCSVM
ncbi:hypothetical protein F2P81_018413 [Scophthalmus maximus]|uniref:Uncharacterized protein n=1 Tax=Scophthalmus maximus TaxID=52904 RepID=A0A6A4SAL9_SCOMX|nr:hypothetical protein F2P81_018413 [Scophthalmus maximus]